MPIETQTEVEKRLWAEIDHRYPLHNPYDETVELQRAAFEAGAVYIITDQICMDVVKSVIGDALAEFRAGKPRR